MTVTLPDGSEKTVAQSGAMMRWAARKFDSTNTLYPTDPELMLEIEEVLGLAEDFTRAWSPSLYMGMGRHADYGHPKEWPEKADTVKSMREGWLKDCFG